jgi:hypothetical protein
VIGAEIRSTLQEQLADAARGIGAAFGVAASHDFVEFGDQRCRWRHEASQTGDIGRFFGNLGGLRERRVRFPSLGNLLKISLNALAGLAGLRKNRYIRRNLWFSYDRVLRVGPAGPALFYYLNELGPEGTSGAVQGTGRTAVKARPNPM